MDSNAPKEDQTPYIYDLYGVIVHYGKGAKFGHYISYVKSQQNEWFKCNDTKITKTKVDEVLKDQAYILFYKLRKEQDGKTTPKRSEESKQHHSTSSKKHEHGEGNSSPEIPLKSVFRTSDFKLPKNLASDQQAEDIMKLDNLMMEQVEQEASFSSHEFEEDNNEGKITKEDIEKMKLVEKKLQRFE